MSELRTYRLSAVLSLLAVLIVATATPAAGSVLNAAPVSPEVAAYLVAHPGGQLISATEISYDNGTFIVAVSPPANSTQGVADCPDGWYCFYDNINYGYPRGRLSACGKQNLAKWDWEFRTESAHYRLNSGTTVFYYYSIELFRVSAGNRARSDVAPYRDWANYVIRYC